MDNKDTACGQADNPGNSASLWKSPYILILIFTICTAVSLEILHYALPSVFARSLSASMAVQINTNPLFATACLGGAAAYFLILKASAAERLTVIFLGSIIDAFFIKERLSIIGPVGQLLHLGIGLCALSIIASIVHAIKAKISGNAEELRKSLEVCGLISVMPILLASSGCYGGGGPLVYDPHLYAMDSIWGVQPGFIIAKVMSSTKILRVSMYIVYFYLSLWMMLAQAAVYLHNEQTGKKHNSFLIPALFFILIALGGSWFYAYFPAVGEMYYCGLRYYPNGPWPEASLSPSPIEAPFELSRNCMPSLHFSWIIASALCVWNLGKSYKAAGGALTGLTFLSTFSVGNHYLIDLIMALPFVAAMFAAVQVRAALHTRIWTASLGLGLICTWLYVLKNSPQLILANALWTIILLAATTAISIYMLYVLNAERSEFNNNSEQHESAEAAAGE